MSTTRRPNRDARGASPGGRQVADVPPSQLAGYALLPLRAFLGFTFCFAGLQKLANPGFFDAHNPASIQAQLAGAARRSPIHALLSPMSHQAVAIGLLMAFAELAVGLGALTGLLTKVAAVGGVLISFSLFLSVSFHTSPYYTGSDIVFVFAWLPLVIAGGGPLSLDAYVERVVAARRRSPGRQPVPLDAQRRQLVGVLAAALGGVALLGAGAVAGIGRLLHSTSNPAGTTTGLGNSPSPSPSATSPSPGASSSASATASNTAGPAAAGTKIGPAQAVPVKGAASFQDPSTGDPALVVQPRQGSFLAFDAVCPHAGCTVQYDAQHTLFVCPCHGSQFNGSTGAVEVGPASTGLTKIAISEGPDGQLYVT
jgi:thiosulfate dehydrogenase [quinone] large subunit